MSKTLLSATDDLIVAELRRFADSELDAAAIEKLQLAHDADLRPVEQFADARRDLPGIIIVRALAQQHKIDITNFFNGCGEHFCSGCGIRSFKRRSSHCRKLST